MIATKDIIVQRSGAVLLRKTQEQLGVVAQGRDGTAKWWYVHPYEFGGPTWETRSEAIRALVDRYNEAAKP